MYKRFFARLATFFRRERAEQELHREIAAHLTLMADDFERRGMTPEDARRAALRAYGGVEQAKELHRDERSFVWLEQALQDLRHACRGLARSPAFVAVAVLSLAFGIGVNAAIFTLVNGILLKNLPVPDPDRIVQLNVHIRAGVDRAGFSFPVYRELRRRTEIFSDIAGFTGSAAVLDVNGVPRKIDLQLVTGSYFPFFGGRPALGRLLDEEDDRVEGAHPVCVLSYPAWKIHFDGDPHVLGQTIRIAGIPLRIVGVAGSDFEGAELQRRYDVWAPMALINDLLHRPRESPNYGGISALARLRPGISLTQAGARFEAASRAIEDALPRRHPQAGAIYQVRDASKGFDRWRSTLHDPLLILLGAVTLVLLVACANLANLALARNHERGREFAIKLALGIGRWRLFRELLAETVVLTFGGGALAFLLSLALTRFLLALFNAGARPQNLHVAPDASILLFTFGVCLLTALIAGLYPAWQASRTDPARDLQGESSQGVRGGLIRRLLILAQVTMAVVLLFGASLFVHSLRNLKVIDLGYDIQRVLTVELDQRGTAQMFKPVTAPPALAAVLARVRQLPRVASAAFSVPGVLSGGFMIAGIRTTDGSGLQNIETSFLLAGPGYLATLRIPLLRGRDFTAADRPVGNPVAIVNQYLASRVWPGQDPMGRHFDGWNSKNIEVVGLIGNTKYQDVREQTKPIAILAFDQTPVVGASLEIRTLGPGLEQARMEREVRDIVKSAAPDYQVSEVATMELMRDSVIAQDRLLAFLSTLFGILGTVLALVGIYGLISYAVTRRTREVGIRVSVGAKPGDVVWMFLRESLTLVAAGMLLGLPLALALARFARSLLFGVSASDPLGIGATLALLMLGGLAAACVPARRATRIDPMQALRHD
jgi:predicted permease